MNRNVDLRSDTVTLPTEEMRLAMYRAEVGDDVYQEDPTVNKLEELGAQMLGFTGGLFVSSGTMGNLVALLAHTNKGDEVFLDADSHINCYEVGGIAALAGAIPCVLKGERGKIEPQLLRNAFREKNIHYPIPRLLCVENTHNRGGGAVTTPEEMSKIVNTAQDLGLKVHVDGARIFNAAVACNCDVKELVKGVDSVQFCLSKGLGAPMGSLLVGSKDFIVKARKWRKMLGGGSRQVGIMAAAGIVALEKMVERLEEDHILAKKLAQGLLEHSCFQLIEEEVETNIVIARIDSAAVEAAEFVSRLAAAGIKALSFGSNKIRFVTHKDISEEDIDYVLKKVGEILEG